MIDRKKIDKVFESTDKGTLLNWLWVKAMTDDKVGMDLLDKFWKPETDDCRAQIEACFMHSSFLKNLKYDWAAVYEDLQKIMDTVENAVKDGDELKAVYLTRHLVPMTCKAYFDDFGYEYQERLEPIWKIVKRSEEIIRKSLIEDDTIDEDSRKGLLDEITTEWQEISDTKVFRIEHFFEDAYLITMPMKKYVLYLNKLLKRKNDFWRDRHVINKMICLSNNGMRDKVKECAESEIKNEEVRWFYVDMLFGWDEYDKALEVSDVDLSKFHMKDWNQRQFDILSLMGNREKTISFCREKALHSIYRKKYYHKLKETVLSEEWNSFINGFINECDFHMDCDDTEIEIYVNEGMKERLPAYFDKIGAYDIPNDMKRCISMIDDDFQRKLTRKYGEWIMERANSFKNRKDYRYLAGWIKELKEVSDTCRQEAKRIVESLKLEHCDRPAMIQEISQI